MTNLRKTETRVFVVPDNITTSRVIEIIGSLYDLRESRLERVNDFFYDTFDWRLFKKQILLRRREGHCFLSSHDGELKLQQSCKPGKIFFPKEISDDAFRDTLLKAVGIRALITLFTIAGVRRSFELRNKEKKTVVRFYLDKMVVTGNEQESTLPQCIYIHEVRGYEKAFDNTTKFLKKAGMRVLGGEVFHFQLALAAINRKPLDYSPKFSIHLDKSATVQQTVSSICLNLNVAMNNNYTGVISDIDSEFLHDFRIAVRRTRSLLSQMKKLLPNDACEHFEGEFRWLGSITGPVRDLDVYLLKRKKYQSILAIQLHRGLKEFFVDLERLRGKNLAAMRNELTSSRYEVLMRDWLSFLNSAGENLDWQARDKVAYKLVKKLIGKRYRRIIKDGGKIAAESQDSDLHRLRIQGKKLRYLLEFFSSFFAPADIEYFLKHLRKLQNNLGDFNDISVQQDMLTAYQSGLQQGNTRSIDIAAALGGLISHLAEAHATIRQKFETTFAGFADEKNKERFSQILLL